VKAAGIRINCFRPVNADELRTMYDDGVDFPLMDKTAEMVEVDKEKGVFLQKAMEH
jgi:hypothetical protein